jgi:hypothetical protein
MGKFCSLCHVSFILFLALTWGTHSFAQTSSRGPRKGPAPGESWGKQTFPTPTHARTPERKTPESPGKSVPENPERWRWVLTNKVGGTAISSGRVPVFGDDGGLLGSLDVGTEIKLERVSSRGKRLFYAVPWTENSSPGRNTRDQKVGWVEGNLIELAGPKS